jgi:hypothetical protein
MRSNASSLAVSAILLGVAACASDVPVSSTFDPLERFPAEARWRWDETRNVLPEDERIVAMDLGAVVKQAVSAELAARGYRPAGSSTADYVLSFQLSMNSRIRAEGSFAIGSLSLLLSDAKSGRRVWMGFAQTEVDVSRSEAERTARLREIVRRMLQDFPPGSSG